MDIVSVLAISLGVVAALLAVIGNLLLPPIQRVKEFEMTTVVKATEIKQEILQTITPARK